MLLTLALAHVGAAAVAPAMQVFGHKIPDTDAICAAMIYTWELEARGIAAKAFRLGDLNRETEYVLNALKLEMPPMLESLDMKSAVGIVDTNNPAELPDGIEKANIHSIIDHHKLSGLTTSGPLEIDARPLCSTGSILYLRAKAAGRTVPASIAGLMLSCILSDSLEFRSPTTTPLDIELAHELAKLAGIDLHAHAEAMLEAKADISHLSPEAVVMMDSKVYTIGGRKLRISVVETTKPGIAMRQKKALIEAQRKLTGEQKLDDCLLFIVDILNEQAHFLSSSASAARTVEAAWNVPLGQDGVAVLPGVLSRKKQIIPKLEAAADDAAGPREKVEISPAAAAPAASVPA